MDYPELERRIEAQIAAGTDALILCGTTGEAPTLTIEEHINVIRCGVTCTAGRIPVIAGAGSNDTETAILTSRLSREAGADALLLVTPYYNKATQAGLIRHYTRIARSVELPVILYNVPSRTGCNLLPETAAALAKNVENIVAIKEASGSIGQVAKLAALTEGCMDIYSGGDEYVVPLLSLGAIGVISVVSNIAPGLMHRMVEAYFQGETEESRGLQLEIQPLVEALFAEPNPIGIKAALKLMDASCGSPRMPLTDLEEGHLARLKQIMKELNFI